MNGSVRTDLVTAVESMKLWESRYYFVAFEIALKHPHGTFQWAVDFVHSDQSAFKGQGGWFIGSDLARGYYEGVPTL